MCGLLLYYSTTVAQCCQGFTGLIMPEPQLGMDMNQRRNGDNAEGAACGLSCANSNCMAAQLRQA